VTEETGGSEMAEPNERIRRDAEHPPDAWRRLRCIQAVLLVCIALLALAGRADRYWPLVTWPVYGMIRPVVPGPTFHRLEVRVVTAAGEHRALHADELVERSRSPIAKLALRGAVEEEDAARRQVWRDFLLGLVERALGHRDFETVAVWSVAWRVDPRRLPPLERDAPVSEDLKVRLLPPAARSAP
jgi:hypothetical protein